MIKHAGARTRAVYRWETEDLQHRGGVKQMKSPIACMELANDLLPKGALLPGIAIRNLKCLAYYQGNTIILTKDDHYNLTMVHELAHHMVKHTEPHDVAFVWQYIKFMHEYFGWDVTELRHAAEKRGLL